MQPSMIIRKASEEDLCVMMKIYADARKFMAENGNPRQWGSTHWPPEDLIRDDIKECCSYVCTDTDGAILATFCYRYGYRAEPCYNTIEGHWISGDTMSENESDTYGVVHRMAAKYQTRGIGTFCLNWAYEQCRHLRIDTHEDNKLMQHLAMRLGFIYCGIIHVEEDLDPRLAYEKFE